MRAQYRQWTKDRVRFAVLLRRVCVDQRSEIIVCDLLLISAALVGVKRATGRTAIDRRTP